MHRKTHKGMNVPRYEILSAWMVQCIFDKNVVPMTTYDAKAVSLAVTIKKSWTNPSEQILGLGQMLYLPFSLRSRSPLSQRRAGALALASGGNKIATA